MFTLPLKNSNSTYLASSTILEYTLEKNSSSLNILEKTKSTFFREKGEKIFFNRKNADISTISGLIQQYCCLKFRLSSWNRLIV
jgi:hypothetical protein